MGAAFAGMAVILGAMGAHFLKAHLTPEQISAFETGVRYQFYHAFALMLLAFLVEKNPTSPFYRYAGICFFSGIILFSGSIYCLSTKDLTGFENTAFVGPLTPAGGVFFITGWILVFVGISKS